MGICLLGSSRLYYITLKANFTKLMIFWDVTPCILVDRQHHCRKIEYLHSVIRASGSFILSRSVVSVYLSVRSVVNFDLLLSFNP